MIRYYAIATAIVVIALAVGLAFAPHERAGFRPETAGASPMPEATGTPSIGRTQPDEPEPEALERVARAPWALSVLPECFEQRASARGPVDFVLAHLPGDLALVPAGSVLRAADCRVRVYRTSALVTRGTSVLFVPPTATIYVRGNTVALLERTDPHAELRVYHASGTLARAYLGPPLECRALAPACLRHSHAP